MLELSVCVLVRASQPRVCPRGAKNGTRMASAGKVEVEGGGGGGRSWDS